MVELTPGIRLHVYNYLRKRGCTREDAEDLSQEVLLKMWQYYNGEVKDLTAWMKGIAHHAMVTRWRKSVTMRREVPQLKEVYIEQAEELLGSYELTDGPVQLQELQKYLSKLRKPLYRQLLELFLQGYELHEIAQMTGMNTANVKTKVHRAKLALLEVVRDCEQA